MRIWKFENLAKVLNEHNNKPMASRFCYYFRIFLRIGWSNLGISNSADIDDSKAAFDIYDTEEDGDISDDLENFYKVFKIIKNPIFKSHF